MRVRLEAPAGPEDLHGSPAPTEAELAAVKQRLECCLMGLCEADAQKLPPVAELPARPAAAAAAAPSDAKKAGKGAPAAGAAAAGTEPGRLEWRDLGTWVRVEALLDPEAGVELVDGGLAGWLAPLLAPAAGPAAVAAAKRG